MRVSLVASLIVMLCIQTVYGAGEYGGLPQGRYTTQPDAVYCATLEYVMEVYRYGKENDFKLFKAMLDGERCSAFPEPVTVEVIESLGLYAGVTAPGSGALSGSNDMVWMLNDHLKPAK